MLPLTPSSYSLSLTLPSSLPHLILFLSFSHPSIFQKTIFYLFQLSSTHHSFSFQPFPSLILPHNFHHHPKYSPAFLLV
jgi:hypothetical protein